MYGDKYKTTCDGCSKEVTDLKDDRMRFEKFILCEECSQAVFNFWYGNEKGVINVTLA